MIAHHGPLDGRHFWAGKQTGCGRYHRILDILTFRSMLREGFIQLDDFVEVTSADREQTLMPSLVSAENITNFFDEYDEWQASG